MMMDTEMMGGHMVWMVAIIALAAAGLALLARHLVSPPKAASVEGFNRQYRLFHEQNPRSEALLGPALKSPAVEENMLIVIPDISGYTRFITKSRFALAHAHFVVEELLNAMLEAGSGHFTPMRIEGDAIVFRSSLERAEPADIGRALVGILRAFYRKRAQLKHDNVCRCSLCKNIAELDLKIIVHAGEVLRFQMAEFEDATGEAMIDAHRLLKGVPNAHRYILVSDQALPVVDLANAWEWTDFRLDRSDNSSVHCRLTLVPDQAIDEWDRHGGSRRSIADFIGKLAALNKLRLIDDRNEQPLSDSSSVN